MVEGEHTMKKKVWLIPVVAIALLVALLVIIVANGLTVSTGRYLQAKDGTAMLIYGNTPIKFFICKQPC
jgi:uncharacterized integral membrane protein